MPTCGHPYLTSGPFNQTNFLGCSVSNFNLSLGWGAEASNLTVKLVKDYRKHWSDDSHWQKWLNQLNNLSSKTTYPTNAFNDASLKKIDQHWSLHRNMLLKEYQKWHQNSSVGIRNIDYTKITNIYQKDDGKFYYKSHGTSVKKIKGSDLGFIGDANGWDGQYDIDIMGNMARFKFAGTATGAAVDYTGIVKGWQYNDGTYSVQLGSPAPILKGCNLILRKYQTVIFVNGCFWHKHDCRYGSVIPKTNTGFWENKRLKTVERDHKNYNNILKNNWKYFVIWECEIKDELMTRNKIKSFFNII